METYRILVIDDDKNHREGMITLLESRGYTAQGACNGKEALNLLEEEVFDLVITDYRMQKMDGMHFLKEIKRQLPSLKVIMVTGYGSIEHAVEAMQSGAINYITKPVVPAKLFQVIETVLQPPSVRVEEEDTRVRLKNMEHFQQMVGQSKPMQEVYRKIQEVAPTNVPVLILGESGTGKELVAQAIHQLSPRKEGPFVAVNTGGIPRELIASELFGHLKGSFTGAISDKKGKFEEAHRGTLFLDEIGTMSIPVQISLLRVLETKMIERVGSNRPVKVDVRIICASNENLLELIKAHKFREDLYYRLNVFVINLPPLRERKQDIGYLLKYYRQLFNLELHKQVNGFSKEALQLLKKHNWPGNVRELRNVVLRAMLSAEDIIDVQHLPPEIVTKELNVHDIIFKAGTPLAEVEKTMIIQTLKAVKGNKLKAAEILGISRRSLYNKLEEYHINDKEL